MTILVPKYPPDFRTSTAGTTTGNEIRGGWPVRSDTWWQMADSVNYLHGRGGSVVTASNPRVTGVSAGSSLGYLAYTWPRYENPHRIWKVTIAASSAAHAFGTITNGTETADWSVDGASVGTGPALTVATLQEEVTASATPVAVTLTVANDSSSASSIAVRSVALYELPRFALDAGYGVNQHILAPRNPIVGTTSGDLSIESVARHARSAKTVARRNSLLSWYDPDGVSDTSGSFVDIFDFEPELRCRQLESANTTRTVAWTAYTHDPSGVGGEVRLTASQSGQTDTMSFSNTTPAWQTPRTLTINTEDPTRWLTDSGLRGGSAETVQAAVRTTSSPTSVTVLAIAIGEST